MRIARCLTSQSSGKQLRSTFAHFRLCRAAVVCCLSPTLGVIIVMTEHLISVKDFAEQNGLIRQTVFKVFKRLKIEPTKSRGGNQNRGQTISYITQDDARRILEALSSSRSTQNGLEGEESEFTEAALYDVGVFYLLSLEPEHDSSRFKVGFASNLNERLRQHRCSAPYIQVVKTWPCRRLWKKPPLSASPKAASGYTPKFSGHPPHLCQSRKNVRSSST